MDSSDVASLFESAVRGLEMIVAGFLLVLLALGVVNLGVLVVRTALSRNLLEFPVVLDLILSSIDIILYLFVIVELYKTVVAYVRAESVVIAVIHAGLIAVVRQIIIFKPDQADDATAAMLLAGTHALLILVLLVGFVIVHNQIGESDGRGEQEP